jgi:hypothetical protein
MVATLEARKRPDIRREPEVLSCAKYPPGAVVKMQVLKDGYVRVTIVRELTT